VKAEAPALAEKKSETKIEAKASAPALPEVKSQAKIEKFEVKIEAPAAKAKVDSELPIEQEAGDAKVAEKEVNEETTKVDVKNLITAEDKDEKADDVVLEETMKVEIKSHETWNSTSGGAPLDNTKAEPADAAKAN
jgi:hypothetical protein